MLELVKNPQGEIVDKRPVEFELRRWKRGIELGAQRRKLNNLAPLREGLFETPWGENQYELPPLPKKVTKPKKK